MQGEEGMICHQEWVVRPSPLWATWRWVAGVFSQLVGPSSFFREGHGEHKSHSKGAAHDSWSQAILGIKPFYGASGVGSWIVWQAARITGLVLPKYKIFHHPFENRKWEANHTLTFKHSIRTPIHITVLESKMYQPDFYARLRGFAYFNRCSDDKRKYH